MKVRKIAYFMMTLSFIMIISGGVSSFVISLKADREETYRRMSDVSDTFEVFSANTSVFEVFRDDLYNEFLGNTYFDAMYLQDGVIKNKLSNYENLVDQLRKNVSSLNKLCNDVYYPEGEVNNKCQNYKTIYEQVVNYFVTDINVYNKNVKKYNDYQLSLGLPYSIEKYKTKKVFIDFNGDKKFDGKEDN